MGNAMKCITLAHALLPASWVRLWTPERLIGPRLPSFYWLLAVSDKKLVACHMSCLLSCRDLGCSCKSAKWTGCRVFCASSCNQVSQSAVRRGRGKDCLWLAPPLKIAIQAQDRTTMNVVIVSSACRVYLYFMLEGGALSQEGTECPPGAALLLSFSFEIGSNCCFEGSSRLKMGAATIILPSEAPIFIVLTRSAQHNCGRWVNPR